MRLRVSTQHPTLRGGEKSPSFFLSGACLSRTFNQHRHFLTTSGFLISRHFRTPPSLRATAILPRAGKGSTLNSKCCPTLLHHGYMDTSGLTKPGPRGRCQTCPKKRNQKARIKGRTNAGSSDSRLGVRCLGTAVYGRSKLRPRESGSRASALQEYGAHPDKRNRDR
jgi:hypothetical protein